MSPAKRKIKGKMNGTEERFAFFLDSEIKAGHILSYKYEAVTLKLAPKTTYCPDFMVIRPDCIEFIEIKGGMITDIGRAKFKIAAEIYPWFVWRMIQWKGKKWTEILTL